MLNILVPTDFSELSKVAIRYALDMAKKMKGKVTLLHVVDTGEHGSSMRFRLNSLLAELERIAEEDFEALKAELKEFNKTGKPIRSEIVQSSSFLKAVSKFAMKSRANLIVMGTQGASGLKKVVMGSNTVSMLEGSGVAVLAVPPKVVYKSNKVVVYATDLKNTQKELKNILAIIGSEKPLIHILHVATDRENAKEAEAKIDKIVSKAGYGKVLVRVMINKDPAHAINEYVKKMKVDLLTLFPHQHSFLEKLFKGSVTKQLTYKNNVPLLAFKKS